MIQDYDKLVEKIAKVSGKQEKEITNLVDAKRAKLSGLISREGAAQIVASELGVNFDKEKVKIEEIVEGMRKVNTLGKIIKLFTVNEYEKNGKKGKVVNFILADDTATIKTVLWDISHIKLIEDEEIKEGDFVEISSARLRNGELHLSNFSDIKKSDKSIDNVKSIRDVVEKEIKDFSIGGNFRARALIVQAFQPKFFKVCPECGKKAVQDTEGYKCNKHGKIDAKDRALLPIVLDDGSEHIRGVIFSDQLKKLDITHDDLEQDIFPDKKQQILGTEAYFSGRIKQNKLYNNTEMLVNNIEKIDIEKLIEELEQ